MLSRLLRNLRLQQIVVGMRVVGSLNTAVAVRSVVVLQEVVLDCLQIMMTLLQSTWQWLNVRQDSAWPFYYQTKRNLRWHVQ